MTEGPTPIKFRFEKTLNWADIRGETLERLHHSAKLPIRHLPQLDPHEGRCVIVAAGPSIEPELENIRGASRAEIPPLLMTINGSHNWLIKNGVIPTVHIVSEPDLEAAAVSLGGQPHPEVIYYICSHCSPTIFKELGGSRQVLWHAYLFFQEYQNSIDRLFPGEFMVGGGYATFFRSLTIAVILGYRDIDLYGIDSSFEESSHLSGYAVANQEKVIPVWGKDKDTGELTQFKTQGGLAYQACEFLNFCKVYHEGLRMRTHGNGLLPHLHRSYYPDQYSDVKGHTQ